MGEDKAQQFDNHLTEIMQHITQNGQVCGYTQANVTWGTAV